MHCAMFHRGPRVSRVGHEGPRPDRSLPHAHQRPAGGHQEEVGGEGVCARVVGKARELIPGCSSLLTCGVFFRHQQRCRLGKRTAECFVSPTSHPQGYRRAFTAELSTARVCMSPSLGVPPQVEGLVDAPVLHPPRTHLVE